MRVPFLVISIIILLLSCNEQSVETIWNVTPELAVIYPKNRIWTTPSAGEEAAFNSPSFQWPSEKKNEYSIRLSSSKDFKSDLIEKNEIPYAIFNPHKKLKEGTWYWQYKANDRNWSEIDSFKIGLNTKIFETPEVKTLLSGVSTMHPRVLAKKDELDELRIRANDYKETVVIIDEAEKHLNKAAPKEESALPTFEGKNQFENDKIALLASRKVGWGIYDVLNSLSQAYILTGDKKYFDPAKKWMLEVSTWDPNGPTHVSNFGDSGIMTGLSIGVDTFWSLLTKPERDKIIKHVAVHANGFYKLWIGNVEKRSSSMHVWQHILHQMLQTSLALSGETSDADLWMEYIYELWIAQCPKLGEKDGAWFNGTGYFRMNTFTMYDVSDIFNDLTGVDFMNDDWYRNNPKWMIYAFPPNAVADGFCNDGDKYTKPTIRYAGYADAAARVFNNPYADWYAKEVSKGFGMKVSDDDEFRWFRIQRGYKMSLPDPIKKFDLPQASVFPDVGVGYMNTTLQNPETNLMLSVRSSPFGSLAHTHADQNSFNIAYGGKRLFYNTGYRPAMGDPHFLGWYKHTQGHNAILIDGEGQPFNAGAYGWIPRFLHGKQISYAVGDASNAYSGFDMGENIDHGMKRFRRHYIMLRPSTIIIYDELEADHDAEWSWLLHNDNGFELDVDKKIISAKNEMANAKVSLFSSSDIDFQVTDQFSIPVENWTKRLDLNGDTAVFENQWHFKGVSKTKTAKMRYLAIIQVSHDKNYEPILVDETEGGYLVGDWKVSAEMEANEPAFIKLIKMDGSAGLVSNGSLVLEEKEYNGKINGSAKLYEIVEGKPAFQEVVDEIPNSIQRAFLRF